MEPEPFRSESEHDCTREVRVLGGRTVVLGAGLGRDERIRRIADAQRGRVARWQLLDAGLTSAAVGRSVTAGRLVAVHRGVYALPGTDALELAPDAAAVLAGGPGSRLSFGSAAVLWRLRIGVADPVHITVNSRRRGPQRAEGIVVHRTSLPHELRIHRGLPVTAPAWTLLDVAGTLPDRDIAELLDEAVFVRRLTTRREIRAVLARSGGHPGRARLGRAAAPILERGSRPNRTESRPQRRLLELIEAAGLPVPRTEVAILDYRLDLYWPSLRLAVEVDTYGTHGSPRRFASDRRKGNRLLAECGVNLLRVTDVDIDERPLQTIATLSRALAARE